MGLLRGLLGVASQCCCQLVDLVEHVQHRCRGLVRCDGRCPRCCPRCCCLIDLCFVTGHLVVVFVVVFMVVMVMVLLLLLLQLVWLWLLLFLFLPLLLLLPSQLLLPLLLLLLSLLLWRFHASRQRVPERIFVVWCRRTHLGRSKSSNHRRSGRSQRWCRGEASGTRGGGRRACRIPKRNRRLLRSRARGRRTCRIPERNSRLLRSSRGRRDSPQGGRGSDVVRGPEGPRSSAPSIGLAALSSACDRTTASRADLLVGHRCGHVMLARRREGS